MSKYILLSFLSFCFFHNLYAAIGIHQGANLNTNEKTLCAFINAELNWSGHMTYNSVNFVHFPSGQIFSEIIKKKNEYSYKVAPSDSLLGYNQIKERFVSTQLIKDFIEGNDETNEFDQLELIELQSLVTIKTQANRGLVQSVACL